MNINKTKIMAISKEPVDINICINGTPVKRLSKYKNPGS